MHPPRTLGGRLILGAHNQSAVLTLVERVSRFVILGHLPTNHGSEEVKRVLTDIVTTLDTHIWSSITWDQGSEMAGHKEFTMAANVSIYFCHPGSPWEGGTNENTNGRLRRNLPKSSDLSKYSAEDFEIIANIHNHEPRKTLGWRTPPKSWPTHYATKVALPTNNPPVATPPRIHLEGLSSKSPDSKSRGQFCGG